LFVYGDTTLTTPFHAFGSHDSIVPVPWWTGSGLWGLSSMPFVCSGPHGSGRKEDLLQASYPSLPPHPSPWPHTFPPAHHLPPRYPPTLYHDLWKDMPTGFHATCTFASLHMTSAHPPPTAFVPTGLDMHWTHAPTHYTTHTHCTSWFCIILHCMPLKASFCFVLLYLSCPCCAFPHCCRSALPVGGRSLPHYLPVAVIVSSGMAVWAATRFVRTERFANSDVSGTDRRCFVG